MRQHNGRTQSPDPHHAKRVLMRGGCVLEFQRGEIRAIIQMESCKLVISWLCEQPKVLP